MMAEKATKLVHWATGPVPVCDQHAEGLKNIGRALGLHVHAEDYKGEASCITCKNKPSGDKRKDENDAE